MACTKDERRLSYRIEKGEKTFDPGIPEAIKFKQVKKLGPPMFRKIRLENLSTWV